MMNYRTFVFWTVPMGLMLAASLAESRPSEMASTLSGTSGSSVVLPAPPIDMAPPVGDGSMTPFLAADEHKLYLSWLSRLDDEAHALRLSSWDGTRWSEPREIHRSGQFFANWADFSSLLVTPSGRLVVHWLEMAGEGSYEYDVYFAISDDQGENWTTGEKLHRDDVLSEHGFVSLVSEGDDGFAAAWLDGRQMVHDGGGANEMSLRFTRFDGKSLGEETLLDARVCECCQTGMTRTSDGGLVVVYRDRSANEIRDTSMVSFDGTRWSEPKTVHEDGWEIAGCPVNGPRVAAANGRLAIGWFSARDNEPRVQVVLSSDDGASLSDPILLEASTAIGRIDLVALAETREASGAAFAVSWLSRDTESHAGLKVALLGMDGERQTVHIGETGTSRASGFPRMVNFRNQLVFAWTESYERGGASSIRIARMSLDND